MDLDFYKKQALQKQKEHKKFLDGLKKNRPKILIIRFWKPTRKLLKRSTALAVPIAAKRQARFIQKRILNGSQNICE